MFDTSNTYIDVKSPTNLPPSFNLLCNIIYEVFNGGKIF